MPSENVHPTAVASSKDEAFNYQMEFLKLEFQAINEVIGRIDETAAKVKNWAVVTWAGSMALGRTNDLKKYLWITAVPPLLFFFTDALWRKIQRRFIFRSRRISEFLNDGRLQRSFHTKQLSDFWIVDPRAERDKTNEDYRKFTSVWRTMRFKEVAVFYLGMSALSLAVWWALNC
jgi:hypothetical protein